MYLAQILHFYDEAWVHLHGYNDVQKYRYWSGINLRQAFEVYFYDQKCNVTAA